MGGEERTTRGRKRGSSTSPPNTTRGGIGPLYHILFNIILKSPSIEIPFAIEMLLGNLRTRAIILLLSIITEL